MSRLNRSSSFAALLLLLPLAAGSRAFAAQPAAAQLAAPSSQSPAAVSPAPAQPAPADPVAVPAAAIPTGPPPTPEQIADSLSVRQRYQAAIAAYAKVPNPSAEVWNKMGIAYQMMFDAKDAARCYNASIKLDSRNPVVFNNLATVYDSMKLYGNGERLYRKALKLDPHSALIHRNLGSNLLAQHKYKKGWESYQTALAIDPHVFQSHTGVSVENPASVQDRGAMHFFMAKSCVSAGNSDCAIQNLRMALNEGYVSAKKISDDNSFASLRELPAFQMMIAAQSAPQ